MKKLNKGEKSLWQMPDEMYYIDNEKKCDIEYFMLTNQNIRIEYLKKITLFKKEPTEILIPLIQDVFVSYKDFDDSTIEIKINTLVENYSFYVCYSRKKSCEKHLNEFQNKVEDLLKKNENKVINNYAVENKIIKSNSPYINAIDRIEIRNFIKDLGPSRFDLNDKNINKIKNLFPIPIEHNVIWADCEFDLRCSGIVCTDRGCFIKSNVKPLDEKRKKKDNGGKSILYYYKWEDFNPTYFSQDNDTNYALTVDPRCQTTFLNVCSKHALEIVNKENELKNYDDKDFKEYVGIVAGVTAGISNGPNANLEFMDQYIRNLNGRHGFFAEQANNMRDIELGRRAWVIGGDNAKSGADRLVKGLFSREQYIQTKYCQSAKASVDAGFGTDGYYKYVNEKTGIMQLEVPSDQYETAVELFKDKIRNGKVVDANGNVLTDPNLANKYVRKGHYTYRQTVKMAEPGNIESLKYDVRTGMVTCLFAFGISSLITMVISYRQHKDFNRALKDGLKVGIKVFGLTMMNHVLLSQLYRTPYFQNFEGNIMLRNTLVTSGVSFVVYSIPNIINVLSKNISFGQFMKNTAVLGAGIAGGAGGALAGGEIGEAIGGKLGKVAGSLIGGLAGGIAGTFVSKSAADVVKEDDIQIFYRLFSSYISTLVIDYMLSEKEVDDLSKELKNINSDDIKKLNIKYRKSRNQEKVIVDFLEPIFNNVVRKRRRFSLPTEKEVISGFLALA